MAGKQLLNSTLKIIDQTLYTVLQRPYYMYYIKSAWFLHCLPSIVGIYRKAPLQRGIFSQNKMSPHRWVNVGVFVVSRFVIWLLIIDRNSRHHIIRNGSVTTLYFLKIYTLAGPWGRKIRGVFCKFIFWIWLGINATHYCYNLFFSKYSQQAHSRQWFLDVNKILHICRFNASEVSVCHI